MARVSDISRAVRDIVRDPFSARHPGGGVIHRAQAEAQVPPRSGRLTGASVP